jgi:general secretion pathway protein F
MQFTVKAVGTEGLVSLSFEAPDSADARRQAAKRGYAVLKVRARRVPALGARRFPLVLFTQELLALLNAGLGVVEALQGLADKHQDAGAGEIVRKVLNSLYQGLPLSKAIEAMPEAFPPIYVEIVRASEKTSNLPQALSRFVAYQQRLHAVRTKLVSASIYPVLLLGVGAIVTLFLIGYVVPRFSAVYVDLNRDLPFFSRLLLEWGDLLNRYAGIVVAVALAAGGGAVAALARPDFRQRAASMLWRLPVIGERLRIFHLSRFYWTLGMLLRGGIPAVPALEMAGGLLGFVSRESLALVIGDVREGKPLSQAMERRGLTTPIALRLLRVGERSGDFGGAMEHIAAFYDEELTRSVDLLTRLFEPLLMCAIGLVIGAIVLLMYMPIFDLAGSLQ